MLYAYLAVSCIAFIELFIALAISRDAMSLINRSREAVSVIASKDMDDEQKEVYMRGASLEMFKSTGLFLAKFLLIGAVLYGIFLAVVSMFPALQEPILASFVSAIYLIGVTVFAMAYAWVRNVVLR